MTTNDLDQLGISMEDVMNWLLIAQSDTRRYATELSDVKLCYVKFFVS